MRAFRTALMRGGVCRGLMFLREDLPADEREWDSIFLQAMGNPDPKQIDGVGGTVSSNSKALVVWKSDRPGVDVEYLAVQIEVGSDMIDASSNCGNMTAAVGPFAVEEGLVTAAGTVCEVRAYNRNTGKMVTIAVPVENGTVKRDGDFVLEGIGGTLPKLTLRFLDPSGAKTGRLLPTGSLVDRLMIDGFGPIDATILDVSNPMVLLRAKALGLTANELPAQIQADAVLCALLEKIRATAACRMGFGNSLQEATAHSPGVPKIGFFSPPCGYTDLTGRCIDASEMDLCVRILSMRQPGKAIPITSANAVAVAALLPGTLLWRDLSPQNRPAVRIGHPSGIMTVTPHILLRDNTPYVDSVEILSSARRIMDGTIYIPN